MIRIHDENGDPVADPDIEGELVYTGPNVMLGYATSARIWPKGMNSAAASLPATAPASMQRDMFLYWADPSATPSSSGCVSISMS